MNKTESFKFAPPFKQRSETVIDKILKWIFYAIAFAFLLLPAVFVVAVVVGIGLAVLAIIVGLSIVLLPVAILLRVLKLV